MPSLISAIYKRSIFIGILSHDLTRIGRASRMTVTTILAGTDSRTESPAAGTAGFADDLVQQHRELFEHLREGFAYCQVIPEEGDGCDFVYLAVNADRKSTRLNSHHLSQSSVA